MPKVLQDYLGGIVRTLLMGGLTYFVKEGYISEDQTVELATWLTGTILIVGWSLYQKTISKRRQLVAQTMGPGVTEAQVIQEVQHKEKTKTLPSVLLAPDQPPMATKG